MNAKTERRSERRCARAAELAAQGLRTAAIRDTLMAEGFGGRAAANGAARRARHRQMR